MKKLPILLSALLLLLPAAATALEDNGRQSCRVCGMYIHLYKDTSAKLTLKNGKVRHSCGGACMLRLVNDHGGPDAFSKILVHDWQSKQELTAESAVYVIGSKLVPDMIPNIIAFAERDEAETFVQKNGGEIIDFTQALLSISPMGMTMPTRIKSAVLPAQGATGIGLGYMRMEMDDVLAGSESIDPRDFAGRPGQMMGPKEMTSEGEMLMVSHGLKDNLTLDLKTAYIEKEMEMYTMGGRGTTTSRNSGLSDIGVSLRYGLWKNTFYSKFLSLLGEVTLPSGDFDSRYIGSPGLQLGTGDFSGTAGLLFSHRQGSFWFHYLLSYQHRLENSDNYKYGDVTRFGAAVHYTPDYNLMIGLEVDGAEYAKNEINGVKVDNTGGFRSYLTGVVNWRFLTALGGNFNLRVAGGLPIYEDMNHYTMGGMEKAQMGGGSMYNFMLSFKRRFQVNW